MTLAEVLMVCVLGVLLMALLVTFLTTGARALLKGNLRVELQQQALVATQWLAADVQRSVYAATQLQAGDDFVRFSLVPYRDLDGGGGLLWETGFVAYGWEAEGPLERRTWDPGHPPTLAYAPDPVRLLRPSAADVRLVLSSPEPPRRVLAKDVVSFALTGDVRQLKMTLQLEKKPQRFELQRTFGWRASL